MLSVWMPSAFVTALFQTSFAGQKTEWLTKSFSKTCSRDDIAASVEQAKNHPERWMHHVYTSKCLDPNQLRLVDMTIVGAHDAGAYELYNKKAACGLQCAGCKFLTYWGLDNIPQRWGLAQQGRIGKQLESGVRYFDFRLTLSKKRKCRGQRARTFFDEECWLFWHCLLGNKVKDGLADLGAFLLKDKDDPDGGHEVVIVAMKLEHFVSKGLQASRKTSERLYHLFKLIQEKLGDYIYDEPGNWWLQPFRKIVDSGKRLLFVLIVGNSALTLKQWQQVGDYAGNRSDSTLPLDWQKSYTLSRKCATKETKETQHTDGAAKCANEVDKDTQVTVFAPFWGKYSNVCCNVDELTGLQLELHNTYRKIYSHNGALVDERPLFVLYWTFTYHPLSDLRTNIGIELTDLRQAAQAAASAHEKIRDRFMESNIIMGDFLELNDTLFKVAVDATFRLPEHAIFRKRRVVFFILSILFLLGICFLSIVGLKSLGKQWHLNPRSSSDSTQPGLQIAGIELSPRVSSDSNSCRSLQARASVEPPDSIKKLYASLPDGAEAKRDLLAQWPLLGAKRSTLHPNPHVQVRAQLGSASNSRRTMLPSPFPTVPDLVFETRSCPRRSCP